MGFFDVSLLLLFIYFNKQICFCADVVMKIPYNVDHDEDATYRLDYTPPFGNPAPNTTLLARDIGGEIKFSNVLAGTMYQFRMSYSNSSVKDRPMYTASITTAPDPPGNILVSVKNGTSALVTFEPPKIGNWASFKLKLIRMSEGKESRNVTLVDTNPYPLKGLTPGGSYLVQIYTIYDKKESAAFAQYKFTTKPNPPVSCIVWFRNETTLRVLWQPPSAQPPSIYTQYKVMIDPADAPESVLFVEKGDPPGPARAIFRDLVPGRPYDITVQTMSNGELSVPTIAQYRTSPLPPNDLLVDPASVTTNSFTVTWQPPDGKTEFEKYQISISNHQPTSAPPVMRNKSESRSLTFSEQLLPGHTYQVTAKTVSAKVSSEKAATVNVTLKPLPVKNLQVQLIEQNGQVHLAWKPDNGSYQDSFEISYTEVYNGTILNGDTNFMTTTNTEFILESFLPGRNYSISVKAVSKQSQSSPVIAFQATRPSPPVIEDLKPIEYGLNISWKSDVNSRQEVYEILHKRNDSGQDVIRQFTEDTHLLIDNLYPGAGYNIRIFAISHGLKSEPHDYFQAVYPKPPINLTKDNVTSNSVTLSWEEPEDSLYSEFSIWLRTPDESKWTKESISRSSVEVGRLKPGERYYIQVNSVSFGVESARPLAINHTVYPSPVTSIAPLVDSTNVTVEFPRPDGRIEYYIINWIPLEDSEGKDPKSMNKTASGSKGDTIRILVDELTPGMKYQFEIYTLSYGLQSNPTPFVARTMPIILSELVVVSSVQETDSMTIRYSPTPLYVSHFDKYRFKLSDTEHVQEKSVNDTDLAVKFSKLVPGKLYNITVWTVSDDVLSQPLYKQDRLYPDPVSGITAKEITDTLITLAWDRPEGEFSFYQVQYLNTEDKLVQNLTTEELCSIKDLKPYRNYTFTLTVVSGSENSYLRESSPVTATFQTQEGLPGLVNGFEAVEVLPRHITFEWSLSESEYNGVLEEFLITYTQEGLTNVNKTSFSPLDKRGTIKDLIPGMKYEFRIQAKTKVGYGPEAFYSKKMPILAPPKPSSQIVPTEVCRTSSTIQIRYRKNYFSDEYGPIIKYTIIVAEDDTKNTSGIEMPSWRDVQAYSVWPPYQVLEPYNPFRNSTVEDYTIGADEDCQDKKIGYCNGPLKGGTVYRVKIRAFTTPNDFTDTDYSFPIQTDRNTLPLILGITLPSFLVIIIITVAVLVIKFGVWKKPKQPPNHKPDESVSLSDCLIATSKPVKLDKFPAYYDIMSADSDFRFSEEFEQLKNVGRGQPCSAADLPCNRPKNRFTNILPFDHSRFKLQPVDDEEGSDYINANYIPGYNSPREFIVTQGPLPSTKDDFWRMCWESNSRAIVMLTKCVEKGREKCDHYWPEDTKRIFYGDIAVTILNENYYPNWCITELLVQRGDVQRVVRHFHFTTWPDFGVPNPPAVLLKFVKTFRDKVGIEPRPIIVHCSAGVGRSGTFIAIDRLLQLLSHSADTVDIFGIVYQMRKERAHMVQTEQQYICIHQCLLAVLEAKGKALNSRDEIHQNDGYEGEKQQTDNPISSTDSNDAEKHR